MTCGAAYPSLMDPVSNTLPWRETIKLQLPNGTADPLEPTEGLVLVLRNRFDAGATSLVIQQSEMDYSTPVRDEISFEVPATRMRTVPAGSYDLIAFLSENGVADAEWIRIGVEIEQGIAL